MRSALSHLTLYRDCVQAACKNFPAQTTLRWVDDPEEPDALRAIFEHRALPTTYGYAVQRDGRELERLNPLMVYQLAREDVRNGLFNISQNAVGSFKDDAAIAVLKAFLIERSGL